MKQEIPRPWHEDSLIKVKVISEFGGLIFIWYLPVTTWSLALAAVCTGDNQMGDGQNVCFVVPKQIYVKHVWVSHR